MDVRKEHDSIFAPKTTRTIVASASFALALGIAGMAMPGAALAEEVAGDATAGDVGGAVTEGQEPYAAPTTATEAEQQLQEAQGQAEDAQRTQEAADAAEQEAQGEADAAQANVDDAQQELDEANQDLDQAIADARDDAASQVEQAEEAAERAQEAQREVDEAQQRHDANREAAEAAVDEAEKTLGQRESALEEAEREAKTAEDEYGQAAATEQAAKDASEAAGRDLRDAEAQQASATDELEQATTEHEVASERLEEAREEKDARDRAVGEREEDKRQADANVTAAEKEVERCQQAADQAARNLEAARQDASGEQAQGGKGSAGFFQESGDGRAASVLTDPAVERGTGTSFGDYVDLGADGDATSIDNMLAALDWIEYCNEHYRKPNGLPELLVTDEAMAVAQRNADFSTSHYQHASSDMMGGVYGEGENLYVSRIGKERAYVGWYDSEKAVWDAAVAEDPSLKQYETDGYGLMQRDPELYHRVGHYLNIIDPSYNVTGLGLNTSGTKGAAVQKFANAAPGTQAYTVDEYRERIRSYQATHADSEQQIGEAQQAKQAADDDLKEATDALAEARERANQAADDLDQATKEAQDAQKDVDDAQAAVDSLAGRVDAAQAALEQAQARTERARGAAEQADEAWRQAKAAADAAKDALSLRKYDVDAARGAVATAQAELAEMQGMLDADDPELEAAKERLREAQAAADVEAAKGRLERANAVTREDAIAGTIADDGLVHLNGLGARVAAAEEELADATSRRDAALGRLDEARQAADQAQEDYLAAVARVGVAQSAFDALVEQETAKMTNEVAGNLDAGEGELDGRPVLTRLPGGDYLIESLPVPTLEGSEFAGWFTEDGTRVSNADGTSGVRLRTPGQRNPLMMAAAAVPTDDDTVAEGTVITPQTRLVAMWRDAAAGQTPATDDAEQPATDDADRPGDDADARPGADDATQPGDGAGQQGAMPAPDAGVSLAPSITVNMPSIGVPRVSVSIPKDLVSVTLPQPSLNVEVNVPNGLASAALTQPDLDLDVRVPSVDELQRLLGELVDSAHKAMGCPCSHSHEAGAAGGTRLAASDANEAGPTTSARAGATRRATPTTNAGATRRACPGATSSTRRTRPATTGRRVVTRRYASPTRTWTRYEEMTPFVLVPQDAGDQRAALPATGDGAQAAMPAAVALAGAANVALGAARRRRR